MPFDSLEEAQASAARLAAVANLQAILLRDLTWSFPEKVFPAGLPISIAAQFGLQAGIAPGNIFYRVHASLTGLVPDLGDLCKLDVTYQLVYAVPETEQFNPEEIEAYGSASVLFMAFPYIREVLQDISGRAGLPGLIMQPLKLPVDALKVQAAIRAEDS